MKIDFNAIDRELTEEVIVSPKEIYSILPDNKGKYPYLRDVQGVVLDKWFDPEVRKNKDTIIKMNTGSGKTVVGLLILKSCIAEGFGPAVYVVPDNYLVGQVIKEADRLGIKTTTEIHSIDYMRGTSILVININQLINEHSPFGLQKTALKIGSIIIDDVHSALSKTEEQFNLTITRSESDNLYYQISGLFKESLSFQSKSRLWEIENGVGENEMLVPFWEWQNKIDEVMELINKNRELEGIKWHWNLVKNVLEFCKCIISKENIEITPNCIPISEIKSFTNAQRRIFMSATLSDDTPFSTHFDVDFEIANILTPDTASDIGERLIVVPQEINSNITDEEIREYVKVIAESMNVIVIVPSDKQVKLWDRPDAFVSTNNIDNVVHQLKSGYVGLKIFMNRYDGIDLPHDACRLLVLDGLPTLNNKIANLEDEILNGGQRIQNSLIQRIEQGMGRGVRANNDHCAIILMGRKLISTLYAENSIEFFSSATRKQFELSDKITSKFKDSSIEEIFSILNYSFDRDEGWVNLSKKALVKERYSSDPNLNNTSITLRETFDLAVKGEMQNAQKLLLNYSNEIEERYEKSWILLHLAEYYNFTDPVEAQNILKTAKRLNSTVIKPLAGIQTDRELKKFSSQAEQFSENINSKGFDANKFIIEINGILSDLNFEPNSSKKFEQAINDLAFMIGFTGKRPETEEGEGPDNLWKVSDLEFFVIECKNETTTDTICKHDCNQLLGSISWFGREYGTKDCSMTPIMIHNSNVFEHACSPSDDFRIMTPEKLELLKKSVRSFSSGVVSVGVNNIPKLTQLFNSCNLTPKKYIETFTTTFSRR